MNVQADYYSTLYRSFPMKLLFYPS